jgi:hypothetical protein
MTRDFELDEIPRTAEAKRGVVMKRRNRKEQA